MGTVPPSDVRSVLSHDLRLALLVAGLLLIGSGVSLEDDFNLSLTGEHWNVVPPPAGLALVLAGSLPLTFRRLAPLSVLAVTAAASLLYQALGQRPEPLPVGVLVAIYTVAVVRRPLIASMAAAAYVVAFTVGGLTDLAPLTDDQYYIDLVSVVATVMVGYGVALGHARASMAEQLAVEVAREQEGRTRAAVAQEQARIAREVHDIVAHDVSVMVAQAGAARRVFASKPDLAANALVSIEAVGRDALDGLRRLVTLLRTDAEQSGRSPQPTLDRLPWLLTQVQRAGLPVELTIRGAPRPLSGTVELNAFRIVQEALTNVLKHAGPTTATVTLDYESEQLRVDVRDRGRGNAARPSTGYGLISMEQRAAMLGGELVAGPARPGFRVSARLPVEDSDRRPVTRVRDEDPPAPERRSGDELKPGLEADPDRRPLEEGVR
jgi:signal transduction histidine kinase